MNPADALTKDYGMYYDGCWMKHAKHGIGRIRVLSGELYFERRPGREEPMRVMSKYLTCWWPRAGAYNVVGKNVAVYIARRAMRNMRKSAVGNDHYYIKWGSPYGHDVMAILRDGPQLMSMSAGVKKLSRSPEASVAVGRDLIIATCDYKPDCYSVFFRGNEAGTWKDGTFEPSWSDNPLTARVKRQLEEAI